MYNQQLFTFQTYYQASRSFDESSCSSIASKERRNISLPPPRSYSDDSQHERTQAYYYSDSDGRTSSPDETRSLKKYKDFTFHSEKPVRRGRLQLQESFSNGLDQEGSAHLAMVDQEGITTLTRHVRNFSLALKELRECFLIDEGR